MSWDTTYDDRYAEMAKVLADQWEMNPELTSRADYEAQLDCIREETLELSRAIRGGGGVNPDEVGEELADLLVTVHLLAAQLDVDPWGYYVSKQKYNMNKTGERGADGKVIDNV